MKNRIVLLNLIIITLSMVAVLFFGLIVSKDSHHKEAERSIIQITEIYAENYTLDMVNNVPDGIRLTIIDCNGNVIADSEQVDVGSMENHFQREEILSAYQGNPKPNTRYSNTLNQDMVYYALKVQEGQSFVFVRVAIPVQTVNDYVIATIPTMVYILLIAMAVSFVVSLFATNGVIKPIRQIRQNLIEVNEGTYQAVAPNCKDKEINDMMVEINTISERLQESISEAHKDKERLHYILSNISDGIVVLDDKGKIAIINKNAGEIFELTQGEQKSYHCLTKDRTFTQAVSDCLKKKGDQLLEYSTGHGNTYMCCIRSLEKGFVVVVLSDITAVKNSEIMRSEFFANASHELKTPLTAIKGFNDIITMQTKDDSVREFSTKIDKEVNRVVTLINDMLNLSQLESGKELTLEEVDLSQIAADLTESLSPLAQMKGVRMSVSGSGIVKMEREHAVELVKNLMENGVRYNNEGGEVRVKVQSTARFTQLIVADNGIGIEEEHQQRIFERFYRVNKSRSRETGGTGLGLSIVKHICSLYKADLSLSSKLGVGTTICITIPKN